MPPNRENQAGAIVQHIERSGAVGLPRTRLFLSRKTGIIPRQWRLPERKGILDSEMPHLRVHGELQDP
jgi:hypothetical protein